MINDGEALLKAAATVSGEGFATARRKFEDNFRRARATLAEASQPVRRLRLYFSVPLAN